MLDRIQASAASFSPAEQRVAALLTQEPRAFSEWPVGEIAERAQVSKPTVVRFCRRLGYAGLSDFKRKLVASLSEGVPFIHRAVNAQDDATRIQHKVIDNTVAALLKYRNDSAAGPLEAAVAALAETHQRRGRLEFHGVGNSGIVAQDGQHKFFRMGFHTVAHSDGHLQIMSASLLGPGDTLVVISNSGRPRDVLDGCQIARKNGATTMAITASGSPLAKLAAIHLAADHPESYERFSPMVSRLLHLTILDILATGVALRIGARELQPKLRQMKSHLIERRYA